MSQSQHQAVIPPLFTPGDAESRAYTNLRDLDDVAPARAGKAFCEQLWQTYHPWADPHFLTEIRRDFDARFWEMYLTCALREHAAAHGYQVECPKPGPDVLIESDRRRIWVEAIVVTDGDPANPNAPVEGNRDEPGRIPDERILLRYANAIAAKYRKYLKYRQGGIIAPQDSYIIALNAYPLTFRWAEPEMPRFLKALFPIGALQFVFDRRSMQAVETRHEYRAQVTKASKSQVATTVFLDNEFSGISAVLHSYAYACMKPNPLGVDFLIAHNPLAQNPVALGLLPADREYSSAVSDDSFALTCHAGCLARPQSTAGSGAEPSS
jgi:hypothetical protein